MKKLVLGSVVAAALVFTGCGSSNSDDDNNTTAVVSDTTAPVITNVAAYTINEGGTVALTATDANTVTFTETSAMFTISGNTLTPEFSTGTNSVEIVATDSKGNHSEKNISVTVNPNNTGGDTVANEVDLGTTLGKWLTVQTQDIDDDLTTMDVNESLQVRITHAEAVTFCTNQGTGWTLPTQADILSIATSGNVADPLNITGQIVLNTSVVTAGSPAATSVIWTSDVANHGVYLGNASTAGNADFDGGMTDYFHTCIKK